MGNRGLDSERVVLTLQKSPVAAPSRHSGWLRCGSGPMSLMTKLAKLAIGVILAGSNLITEYFRPGSLARATTVPTGPRVSEPSATTGESGPPQLAAVKPIRSPVLSWPIVVRVQ